MTILFCLFGGILLAGCGAGSGYLLAAWTKERWHTAHAFERLLRYLEGAVRCQPLTGQQLLTRAARFPEFSRLDLAGCTRFGLLVPPECFDGPLRQELSADLNLLESAPRESACQLLARMAELCHGQAEDLRVRAKSAAQLYPRLGGCVGALAALCLL